MRRWLLVVVVVVLPAVAGCRSSPAAGTFGRPCDDPSQCGTDAPRCVAVAAPDYAPGVCATNCPASGSCPAGSECQSGACIRCVTSIAGTVPSGEPCGCDTDCAAGTCVAGVCAVDCRHMACPGGSSCDGNPPTCRACIGGTPADEQGPCSCDLDCASGLSCIADLCLRPCLLDEMCGADECRHEILTPPACGVPDGACVGDGSAGAGDPCACNADCGPIAPLCVGAFLGGNRAGRCGNACGPEMICPSGTMCCSAVVGRAYCVPPDVMDAYATSCL